MEDFLNLDDLVFEPMSGLQDMNLSTMPDLSIAGTFLEEVPPQSLKRERSSDEETAAPSTTMTEVPLDVAPLRTPAPAATPAPAPAPAVQEGESKKKKKKPLRKEQRRDFLEAKVGKLETENSALMLEYQLLQKEDQVLQEQLALLQQAQARLRAGNNNKLSALSNAPMLMPCVPTIVSRSEIA